MSILCCLPIVECVSCIACTRWLCKRAFHTASHDSTDWPQATAEEFQMVPRLCRYILSVYEDDINNPLFEPRGGYGIDPDCLLLKRTYKETQGRAPPYILYLDHPNNDIVLALRGLNMAKEGDYAVLLDNKLGQRKIDGGYVHNGLLNAAVWVLESETDVLNDLLEKYPNYTLTFTGHSLGSGVASMMALAVLLSREKLGNIDRARLRCFAIAPARSMSLNLAVRYADVISSVVLQDDFLPRTATPLEDIFQSVFCLPCLLCSRCLRDTCVPEERWLKDPRRLYAPGRLYHIVERKVCRFGKVPPVVKTAVPVDGRFEHVVVSCNATSDHSIVWVERQATVALEMMRETEGASPGPAGPRMKEEHRLALQRAVKLAVPHALSSGTLETSSSSRKHDNWKDLIEKMFDVDDSGFHAVKRSHE